MRILRHRAAFRGLRHLTGAVRRQTLLPTALKIYQGRAGRGQIPFRVSF